MESLGLIPLGREGEREEEKMQRGGGGEGEGSEIKCCLQTMAAGARGGGTIY